MSHLKVTIQELQQRIKELEEQLRLEREANANRPQGDASAADLEAALARIKVRYS